MKLKIIAPRNSGHGTKVFLDGKDISSITQNIIVRFEAGEVNQATIQIIPSQIEIEGEIEEIYFRSLINKNKEG